MNLLTRSALAPTPTTPATPPGRVPDSLLSDLRTHGLSCPARGLSDPGCSIPNCCWWMAGREKIPPGCSYAYVYPGDTAAGGSQRWEQSYQVQDDGSCVLISRCGHTENTIQRDPQGRINTSYRTV